jgi:glycosyltransferase involved in cell wall biosynthesis
MLQIDHPKSVRQRKIYQWIEQQTIKYCDKAVFTTFSAQNSYKQRFPQIPDDKFVVIENGYDEEGFTNAEIAKRNNLEIPDKKITLLHSGVLYNQGRDPSAFFSAIAALKNDGNVDKDNLKVILRASGDDAYFIELVKKFEVQDIVKIAPPIPYQEALTEMLSVQGLLLFQGSPFNRQIPAKIYEYYRSKKPIFGLLDPSGDTASILRTAGFHDIAEMDSVEAIIAALKFFLEKIQQGKAHVATEAIVYASSRKHRARQLSEIFSELGSK